jgi:hypothetical protein
MLRIDNRDIETAKSLIVWCQNDDFEKINVLSIAKLRARFDSLEMKMRNPKQPRNGKPAKEPTFSDILEEMKREHGGEPQFKLLT